VEAAARELMKISDQSAFDAKSRELDGLYPGHAAILAARARRLIRLKKHEEATALIDSFDFGDPADGLRQMVKAELLYDAQEQDRADGLFVSLIGSGTDHAHDIGMRYSKRLFTDGRLGHAIDVLAPVRDRFGSGGSGDIRIGKLESLLALLTRLEGRTPQADENCRMLAMKHAILHFRDREIAPRSSDALGRLALITGGLGPGGAERQLTRLAGELERARKSTGAIGGIPLDRPVEVLVRSHGPEKQNDFYLADLESERVELGQINDFDVIPPEELGVQDADLLQLLNYLPPSPNFGVRRLTRHFVQSGTDTVSVWQDGACLFAGLAALIAGVPQIQLAIRGLPPSMRRHMFRPEYEVFYRAMAQIPGVTFVSNSISAARAYTDWLEIPLERFGIVYNGVEPMRTEPCSSCEEQWSRFVEVTPNATHTIGGVFRFDTDKQPLLWVRFAARYLKAHSDARMVLVGGGRLLDNAIELAEHYGIRDRLLFVGRSTRVGFWMARMDALVLLSRYEGLPNVLIEAQYMGVRVVTTPAGGASECLIDGTTGHVLGCAEKPDYEEIVTHAHKLALQSGDRALFAPGGVGRTFLDAHFSIPHMLAQYVRHTSNGLGPVDFVESETPRSLEAA
jgi:glycosyltransferase involved in cell wall biosynthesis